MNRRDTIIKWIATALLLVGTALTSYNEFPANLYVGICAEILWLYTSYRMREVSLVIINLVILAVQISGVLHAASS